MNYKYKRMLWWPERLGYKLSIDDYYLVSIFNIVSREESRTPTVNGCAYILGRADHYGKDDQEYHSVSMIETVDVVVIVPDVNLGDWWNSADKTVDNQNPSRSRLVSILALQLLKWWLWTPCISDLPRNTISHTIDARWKWSFKKRENMIWIEN